jgi:hypothetical protein
MRRPPATFVVRFFLSLIPTRLPAFVAPPVFAKLSSRQRSVIRGVS